MQEDSYPVVYDVTHSVQLPGGKATRGRAAQFIEPLARAGVAREWMGFFWRHTTTPRQHWSDGPNALPLSNSLGLLMKLKGLNSVVRRWSEQ